jgi:hypothetical protein
MDRGRRSGNTNDARAAQLHKNTGAKGVNHKTDGSHQHETRREDETRRRSQSKDDATTNSKPYISVTFTAGGDRSSKEEHLATAHGRTAEGGRSPTGVGPAPKTVNSKPCRRGSDWCACPQWWPGVSPAVELRLQHGRAVTTCPKGGVRVERYCLNVFLHARARTFVMVSSKPSELAVDHRFLDGKGPPLCRVVHAQSYGEIT